MHATDCLYPPIEPFDRHMLDVGDGHRIYVEEVGTRGAPAVVVLHGGPGGGISPAMRRYFDPAAFHVVLFDQRGCGRSEPHASVAANTTGHLIADIERIRTRLGIDGWIVFGGSWGATLALLYAQAHPAHVRHLVLRGVFTMTRDELDWFYGGGAARFWPDAWARFIRPIPEVERGDLIAAYHKRLFSGVPATELSFARHWAIWENALARVDGDGYATAGPARHVLAFSRLENHYFRNRGFLRRDDQIAHDMDRIRHLPADIVQGRLDMICPPGTAIALAAGWPRARLQLVPGAGHALSEPAISRALRRAMDALRR